MDQLAYGSSSDTGSDSGKSENTSSDSNSSSDSDESNSEDEKPKKPTSNVLPSALDALKSVDYSKSFIGRAKAAAAVTKKETTVTIRGTLASMIPYYNSVPYMHHMPLFQML